MKNSLMISAFLIAVTCADSVPAQVPRISTQSGTKVNESQSAEKPKNNLAERVKPEEKASPGEEHDVEVLGDFSTVQPRAKSLSGSDLKNYTAQVTYHDGSVHPAKLLVLSQDRALVSFHLPSGYRAKLLLVQKDIKTAYATLLDPNLRMSSPTITADFSEFFSEKKELQGKVKDYRVILTDDSGASVKGDVSLLTPSLAQLEFSADPAFKPRIVTIANDATKKLINVFYQPAPPMRMQTLQFTAPELATLCSKSTGGLLECPKTDLNNIHVDLYPQGAVEPKLTAIQHDMAFVQYSAPLDYKPTVARVTTVDKTISVLARSIPYWPVLPNKANLSFSVLDNETVSREFGHRIANRYWVVDLHFRNPTFNKLQVRKSSMWFDVDYARAGKGGKRALWPTRKRPEYSRVPEVLSDCPTATAPASDKKKTTCVAFPSRNGLEQQMQQHVLDHGDVLNTFDAQTYHHDKLNGLVDITATTVTSIAGFAGGESFRQTASVFAGSFVPRLRRLIANEEREKRLRKNLVDRTFQEIIPIPPRSSMDTAVLLPRYAMMGDEGFRVITGIRDVHVDPELVMENLEENILKGEIRAGLSEAQVLQALGSPTSREDVSPGRVTYTYSQCPPHYRKVYFEAGNVSHWDPFSVDDITKGTTAESVMCILQMTNRPSSSKIRNLRNGGEVWLDLGPAHQNILFEKGVVSDPKYRSAQDDFAALKVGVNSADVHSMLEKGAASNDAVTEVKKSISDAEKTLKNKEKDDESIEIYYRSPFASNEQVKVTYGPVEAETRKISKIEIVLE